MRVFHTGSSYDGAPCAAHNVRGTRSAIRNAWNGKAKRKAAERKADSRSGSANVPVIECITISSEPCSLEMDPSSLGVGMDSDGLPPSPSDGFGFYQSGPAPAGCAGGGGSFGSSRSTTTHHIVVSGCTWAVARLVLPY